MARVVGDEGDAAGIEADAVGERALGHFEENLASAVRRDAADGRLSGEAYGIDVAVPVTGRSFDLGGERMRRRERRGDEQDFSGKSEHGH